MSCSQASADIISKPYTFVPLTPAQSAQVNANFDTIYNNYNGNIADANIKAGAAIQLSKLALIAIALNLRSTGNDTWASGITGDTVPRVAFTSDGWVMFGAGSATPKDVGFIRLNSTTIGVRDAANSADENFKAAGLTLTGALTVPAQAAYNFFGNATGSSAVPSFAAIPLAGLPTGTSVVGGNGTDGAVTLSADPAKAFPQQINATTFATSGTFTGNFHSGTTIYATSALTVGSTATFTVTPEIAGATPTTRAAGPGAPAPPVTASAGGNGGGCGGAGGTGGGSVGNAQLGGPAITNGNSVPLGATGSGGTMPQGVAVGTAGKGGGFMRMAASGILTNNGVINIKGGDAVTSGASSGPGGGSAGVLALYSEASTGVVNVGTINGTGGAGGTTSGATTGAGGGGPIVIAMSPSQGALGGTVTKTGGAAGTGGTAGSAGGTGVEIDIQGSPSFPIMAMHEKYALWMAALAQAKDTDHICFTEHENLTLLSAFDSPTKKDFDLCMTKLTGSQETVTITKAVDYQEDNSHV